MKRDKEQYLIDRLHSGHIGDDGAVIGTTVYSSDAFCEDIHFRRAWMTPAQIGRKAMLVNLSDAVAMNARPQYALVTIGLPDDFSEQAIDELLEALESTAAEWGCEIIGGDTVGGDRLHLAITLISHSDAPLLRTGLRPGDHLAWTGKLGESLRDLTRLEAGETLEENSRFFLPTLRADFIREGRTLLRAGMDISDGLYCDTNKLLALNGMGMVPLRSVPESVGQSGEEYEMLIGFDPHNTAKINALAQSQGFSITVFAEITQNTERFPCKSHHFG